MLLQYRSRETAEFVRDALRAVIAPVFSVPYQPNADGFYYVECDDELVKAIQLTAIAFPPFKTRELLFDSLRSVIRKGE